MMRILCNVCGIDAHLHGGKFCTQPSPYSDTTDERNYTAEAFAILKGTTMRQPERRHLEAMQEHYQNEILKIVHDIDQVTTATLKRN